MFWYLVVFACLLALALVERGQKWPGITAAVILGAMCALRYETGFDWVEYELHYALAPGLFTPDLYAGVNPISYEPGFELVNRALRSIGAGFAWLVFVIGVFNLVVLYAFIRRFSPLILPVLIWYYGFVFLTGQMATMRQSLSVSFIYLAMMARNDGRIVRAVVWSVVAVSMHSFAIIFLPLVFVSWRPWRASILFGVAVLGFAASTIGGNLFAAVANAVLQVVDAGVVAERLEIYSSLVGAAISPVSIILVAMHIAFVAILRRRGVDDYIANVAGWSAWLIVILHTWFASFPILWNRVMLVTFPLEAIVLLRIYHAQLADWFFRARLIIASSGVALVALVYALANEQSLVYEPYENVAVTWVRGPYGTGRLRYQIIRAENNSLLAEQKR